MSKLHRKVAVSLTARDFVRQYFPGDYSIIPNGIDIAAYTCPREPIPELQDGKLNLPSWGAWTSGRVIYLLKALPHVKYLPQPAPDRRGRSSTRRRWRSTGTSCAIPA